MGEFYYRISDDSMSGDRIYLGDEVLVQETQMVLENDICAIACESDISQLQFRRIKEYDDGFLLTPSNPEMKAKMQEAILVVGKVIMTHKNT